MTPAQCKDARNLLGWGREKLAVQSGVDSHVIRFFENTGRIHQAPLRHLRSDRGAAIRAALEFAGVEFIQENGGGAGVRMAKPAADHG